MIGFTNKTLLIVAPHPDDEVIGCGGLISRMKASDGDVYVMYLTVGTARDFTGRGISTADERLDEVTRVADFFRFSGWRIVFSGDQYHLQLDRLPQKQLVHEIERGDEISLEAIRPDILAFPALDDYNQDHRAAALAVFTACRPALLADKYIPPLILSYESPMSGWTPQSATAQPNFFVRLTARHVHDKLNGMEMYRSQARGKGHARHTDTLRSLACLRGSLVGCAFAEAFFCHKFAAA